ncbi:MAG: VWA domain-containing protein, partial [Myxococcota bacterium]|nr:VWA domain-containing protein [Myxococcota bacterium]
PGPTEAALITVLSRIPAGGGTPTAVTLSELLPTLRALAGKTYVILATDGGPNCNGSAQCGVTQCTYNIENTTLCPAGGPNCCSDPNNGGPFACLDAQPTIDAVKAIAAAGIPVYVVGVPGSAPYASLLDQLALAGGTARAAEPLYYAIDSADQSVLLATLSSIAAKITGSCVLDLGNVPPDPGQVNVFLDERVLPQAGPNGWILDGTNVTILGASCQMIVRGDVLDVRVVAGCPTVTL